MEADDLSQRLAKLSLRLIQKMTDSFKPVIRHYFIFISTISRDMRNIFLIGTMLFTILMSGCVYYPQLADVPLIHEKHDLRADAGISAMISANATVSYGLTDKLAFQVYGNILNGYYGQAAIGHYRMYYNRNVIEFYGGFGYGYGDAYRDAGPGDLEGNYRLVFTQINFGHTNAHFAHADYGFGIKAGWMNSSFRDLNFYRFYSEYGPFKTYTDQSLLIEPTLFVRLGGEKLKFNLKTGGSWVYKFTHQDKFLPYSRWNIGIGLNYSFR